MMTIQIRSGACNLCEAMCALRVEVSDDRVVSLRGDHDDPLSRGHICPKAFALPEIRDDPDRLRTPVRKVDGRWEPISWDEAIATVAEGLARSRKRHGADSVAVYMGNPVVHSLGAMTHGTAFARLLATRNRYSAGSLDTLPHMIVSREMYGHQWLSPVPDIDHTRYLLILGANPVVSNGSMMTAPGFASRMRRLRQRGGRVVVIDPRRTETARAADAHHFIRPGGDAALVLAMVRIILDEGLERPASYVTGTRKLRAAVEPFTPDMAARATAIPAATIRALAREFATAESAACYGRIGVSTQRHGVLCHWGIQVLNALTGNLDSRGGTLLTTPAVDPIRSRMVPRGDFTPSSRVRGLPGFSGERPAVTLVDEMAATGTGQVRSLLTVAGNPVSSVPGGDRLDEALPRLDFMAAVDFYVNETTRHADVILPPTEALERDHYDLVFHMLAVRDTARYTPAVFEKSESARHDWEIFAALGRQYAKRIRVGQPLTRLMLRINPARLIDWGLRGGPHRLSLRALARRGNRIDLGALRPGFPKRLRTPGKRLRLAPERFVSAAVEAAEQLSTEPANRLRLIGRRQTRDNNSWMHNSPLLTRGRPRHQLWMNPTDMDDRGIGAGQRVRIRSDAGTVEVEAEAHDGLMPGVVSLPHGFGQRRPGVRLRVAESLAGVSANDVTDPAVTETVGATAVLTGVPVTVEPV